MGCHEGKSAAGCNWVYLVGIILTLIAGGILIAMAYVPVNSAEASGDTLMESFGNTFADGIHTTSGLVNGLGITAMSAGGLGVVFTLTASIYCCSNNAVGKTHWSWYIWVIGYVMLLGIPFWGEAFSRLTGGDKEEHCIQNIPRYYDKENGISDLGYSSVTQKLKNDSKTMRKALHSVYADEKYAQWKKWSFKDWCKSKFAKPDPDKVTESEAKVLVDPTSTYETRTVLHDADGVGPTVAYLSRRRLEQCSETSGAYVGITVLGLVLALGAVIALVIYRKRQKKRRDTFGFLPNSQRNSLTACELMV